MDVLDTCLGCLGADHAGQGFEDPFLFIIALDYALRKAISGREEELGFTLTQRQSRTHPAVVLTDLD